MGDKLRGPEFLMSILKAREENREAYSIYPFWGHKGGSGAPGSWFLSQWWTGHPFVVGGVKYTSCEQFMMAKKAKLFGDTQSLGEIMSTDSPAAAKALGRKVSPFDSSTWDSASYAIVVEGNLAKFSQNAELKKFLLTTAGTVLVEASPYDKIWGVGLAMSDSRIKKPSQWQGQNRLGFALCEVRQMLLQLEPPSPSLAV